MHLNSGVNELATSPVDDAVFVRVPFYMGFVECGESGLIIGIIILMSLVVCVRDVLVLLVLFVCLN